MANPFDQFDAPQQGPVYGPPPKAPAPRDPLAVQLDQLQIQQKQGELATQPLEVEIKRFDLEEKKRQAAAGPQLDEAAQKAAAKRAALTSLETQINRVDDLYRKGFKDEALGFISSLSEYLPSDDASALNTAGAGLAEQGLAAFRVPGVGSQSDTELRQFVEANRPSSWDRDVAVEEKLQQLRGRVDATRAEMGLPPAQWGGTPQQAPEAPQGGSTAVYDANLGGEQVALSQNGTQTVQNPELAGVRGEYLRRLSEGQSAGEIIPFLREAGVRDPKLLRSVLQQIQFRKQNPNVPIDKYNTEQLDLMDVPLSGMEGAMNDLGQSAPGAYLMRAGNAVSMNTLDDVAGAMGGNAERVRIGLEDAGRNNPGASLVGDISGGVMAALGGEAGLARLGMSGGAGRALLADTGYGAAAGAGMADDGNRLAGAGMGSLAGLVGSVAGQGVVGGAGAVARGVSDPSVSAVSSYAPITPGQALGRSGRLGEMVKGVEDRIAGLPVVGDVVNARRREGVRAMNSKAFDKALEPIGESVGNKVGEEAVAEARGIVSNAFQKALAGKVGRVDVQFAQQARAPMERLASIKRDGLGEEIVGQIEEATMDLFDESGNISGENMQALLESLRQIRSSYKGDPLGKRIGDSVKQVERAVEGIFERQAPDVMPQYRAAKQAYRRLSTVADAVNAGKNTEGMFTPAQLGTADRGNAKKYGSALDAASGNSPFFEFQRDAQNVLPNRIPDSGTAGRLAVPAGLIAGGAGIGAAGGDAQTGAQTGMGLATFLSLIYSRQGSRLLSGAATKRGAKAKAVGNALKKQKRIAGAGGAVVATQANQN